MRRERMTYSDPRAEIEEEARSAVVSLRVSGFPRFCARRNLAAVSRAHVECSCNVAAWL